MPLSPHRSDLCQALAAHIRQAPHQRISFADYMAWVLHHPEQGYYATQSRQIGLGGDFITAPHLGADFGELLAEQLAEMWQHLVCPEPFDLVEVGAGQGLLAADILRYLQQHHAPCYRALRYTLVETSPAFRTAQRQQLQPWQESPDKVRWCSLGEIPPESLVGCIFSNELLDALPVHRVVLTPSGLQEIYITPSQDDPARPFGEVLGALSTPALADYFTLVGVAIAPPTYPLGYTTEVNLAALDWLSTVAARLHHGYVLTLDYGYPAHRYYSPARSQGTLQCYTRHAHHSDPLGAIGAQDITAHVDFTALERHGERCGLTNLGWTPQGVFLMALGLGDRLAAIATLQETDGATLHRALQRREALHQLINPLGMGNFGVLIQQKTRPSAPPTPPLRGLTLPT